MAPATSATNRLLHRVSLLGPILRRMMQPPLLWPQSLLPAKPKHIALLGGIAGSDPAGSSGATSAEPILRAAASGSPISALATLQSVRLMVPSTMAGGHNNCGVSGRAFIQPLARGLLQPSLSISGPQAAALTAAKASTRMLTLLCWHRRVLVECGSSSEFGTSSCKAPPTSCNGASASQLLSRRIPATDPLPNGRMSRLRSLSRRYSPRGTIYYSTRHCLFHPSTHRATAVPSLQSGIRWTSKNLMRGSQQAALRCALTACRGLDASITHG